jgi:methylenetetrahydrofolate dehydrogenase (NADP+) / methenyltetrahydrofolate cyclohydrolase
MVILDGKKLADEMKTELKTEVFGLKEKNILPGLAVVLVGDDEASRIYVRHKEKACHELGIQSFSHHLLENVSEKELLNLIFKLNTDKKVHGILVQLPLPKYINETKIIESISPEKDIDCFHPENIGKLFLNEPRFLPCTPAGILALLKKYRIEISGRDILIIGKSNIVGKPLSLMLSNLNATVTLAHIKTKNLKEKTLSADIIITAVGRPGLITADMVKQDVVIVDVGMNRDVNGKISGDVDFEKVSKIASHITPVPGGVGPMTIAILMKNTLTATKNLCE